MTSDQIAAARAVCKNVLKGMLHRSDYFIASRDPETGWAAALDALEAARAENEQLKKEVEYWKEEAAHYLGG